MHDILLLNIVRDNSLSSSFLDCLGQHSIASYLELNGYVARVFSGRTNEVKEIINSQLKHSIKAVGFYVSSDNLNISYNIIKWIKEYYDLKVIIGGPEAVSCNENFIREKIALLRIKKGVSARNMSLSIGQNETYINSIGQGKTFPSIQGLIYICEYFGINLKDFFDVENNDPAIIVNIVKELKKLKNNQLVSVCELLKSINEPK